MGGRVRQELKCVWIEARKNGLMRFRDPGREFPTAGQITTLLFSQLSSAGSLPKHILPIHRKIFLLQGAHMPVHITNIDRSG